VLVTTVTVDGRGRTATHTTAVATPPAWLAAGGLAVEALAATRRRLAAACVRLARRPNPDERS
jgi:hypothetical protein